MKKAFTMIELIFIIVVVGILAAVAIPRIDRDNLIELVDQVTTHIRYTQQLAMMDNVYDGNETDWYKNYWRIDFRNAKSGSAAGWRYNVYKNTKDNGGPNSLNKIAVDPQNPRKHLTSDFASQNYPADRINKKLDLKNTYDIKDVAFTGCGDPRNKTIAFDSKGRPHSAPQNAKYPYDKVLHTPCIITFTDTGDRSIQIAVQPETGFISDNRAEAIEKNWKVGNFEKFLKGEF